MTGGPVELGEAPTWPQLIFDAKYKFVDSWSLPNAAHYQMLGYCTALKVDRAWLAYTQGSACISYAEAVICPACRNLT